MMGTQSFSFHSRPFKIGHSEKQFKGIVANSLKDLIDKSIKSLSIQATVENIQVTLAEDGTIIDDEEYFATLTGNTKLILKSPSIISEEYQLDVTDGGSSHQSMGYDSCSPSSSLSASLKNKLSSKSISECIIAFVTLSNEDLDYLINCDLNIVMEELNIDKDVARVFVDNALKELARREEFCNATQLIQLFERAKEKSSSVGYGKRKMPEI